MNFVCLFPANQNVSPNCFGFTGKFEYEKVAFVSKFACAPALLWYVTKKRRQKKVQQKIQKGNLWKS